MTTLIPLSDLLRGGWKLYRANVKRLWPMSAWMYFFLAFQMAAQVFIQNNRALSPLTRTAAVAGVSFLTGILVIWPSTRIIRLFLAKDHGGDVSPSEADEALRLVPSVLWVHLLGGVIAVFGLFLFIVPGIWLSILLGFAGFSRIEDGKKGVEALKASARLVKGRWWSVFFRVFVPGMLYAFANTAVALILIFATGIIAIVAAVAAGQATSPAAVPIIYFISFGVPLLSNLALVFLFLPLCIAVMSKLFHSMKDSSHEAPVAGLPSA